MKKLVILCDMDDTIEQLVKAWIGVVNEKYGYNTQYEDVVDWNLAKAFPGLSEEEVYNVHLSEEFWEKVEPIPGAPEALQELINRGHEVYIVTAAPYPTVAPKIEKVLIKYFPFIDLENVIITWKKTMLKADVLIDDGIHNLVGGDYHKILVDAPYNREFNVESLGIVRVHNWTEIMEEIAKLENEE